MLPLRWPNALKAAEKEEKLTQRLRRQLNNKRPTSVKKEMEEIFTIGIEEVRKKGEIYTQPSLNFNERRKMKINVGT